MGNLGERLLPLLLAVVAGLVLAVGIRGFRAEQPSAFRLNPFSTTPLVTEAPPPASEEVTLADGATLILRPGSVAFDLARFLNGNEPPPRRFPLSGVALPLDGEDAASRQALRSLAAVLRAWPDATIAFEGDAGEAGPVIDELRGNGVDAARMSTEAEAAPSTARADGLQPSPSGVTPQSSLGGVAPQSSPGGVAPQPSPGGGTPQSSLGGEPALQLVLTGR